MFDRILIKSGSKSTEQFLSIRDIVDMMFYYGEVHVVVSQFELHQLLQAFGEDILYELITSKRLFVHPCGQHIGAVRLKNPEICSAGMYRHNINSLEQLLYMYHRAFIRDSTKNTQFARKFSKILEEYRYPDLVQETIYKDIEDETFLSEATRIFIKQYYHSYRNYEEIALHAEPFRSQLEGMYRVVGNIRMDELNEIHHKLGYPGNFSYSNVLLAIGETAQDCYLSSELTSDMMTNKRWAETYKLRMSKCIANAERSNDNIERFHQTVAYEFFSLGEALVSGQITSQELINRLNAKNSIKFREWLKTLPDESPLPGEFYNKIRELNSDKVWIKATRVITQCALGLVNIVAGVFATTMDGFVCDKIINGWSPKLFVEDVLRDKKLIRKSK